MKWYSRPQKIAYASSQITLCGRFSPHVNLKVRENSVQLKKVCSAFLDAVFKSVGLYPLYVCLYPRSPHPKVSVFAFLRQVHPTRECRLYLQFLLGRADHHYAKKRARKERKHARATQRAEKMQLYTTRADKIYPPASLREQQHDRRCFDGDLWLDSSGEPDEDLDELAAMEKEASKKEDGCIEKQTTCSPDTRAQPDYETNMMPILAHLGFKNVWKGFLTHFLEIPFGSVPECVLHI